MDCYVGQILLVPYTFVPVGWLPCWGQTISIQGHETLFSLIGAAYGGDGQTNFALPDLRGRTPVNQGTSPQFGSSYQIGQKGGCENVVLNAATMPAHTHAVQGSGAAGVSASPGGGALAEGIQMYDKAATSTAEMSAQACGMIGGNQQHQNLQPYLPLTWIIADEGIYPPFD